MSDFIDVKDIMNSENSDKDDSKTENYISFRGFDKVEAAERGLILAKTEKYLRTEVNKYNRMMPNETRKLYNETIKNLRILSDMEHETVKFGD